MKILQINSASNWGGGEVYTVNLCQKLISKGHEVTLACRPDSAIKRKALESGIPIFELPLVGAVDFQSSFKLSRFCKEKKINIVHVHLARDYWIARYVKIQFPSIHLIFTRHLLKPIKSSVFHKWLFRKVNKVIAVSDAVKESLLMQNLLPHKRIITIYNGIDVNLFDTARSGIIRKEFGFDDNLKLIGMVGQIAPHKGNDFFIKSASLVSEHFSNVKFLMVGDDFQGGKYIEELRQLSKNLGIGDRVIFLGPRTDIPEIMKDLDLFVFASKNDSFGLVITEAMAAGVPVIATNAGGAKEIILNKKTGFLVDADQPNSLVDIMVTLLKDENMAKTFGDAGRKRAFEKFNIERMVDEIISVYNEVFKN